LWEPVTFSLAFRADRSDESSCANQAPERIRKTNMTNAETNTAATVAEQGAHVAPEKAPPKNGATRKKGAPKGQKTAKGSKTRAAAHKKVAKASKKASKSARVKENSAPRAESKGAKILAFIQRPKGATLAELAKLTGWQNHSVRGFLSGTVGKKMGLTVESAKRDDGQRVYSISK
jgi:hypothetical protein